MLKRILVLFLALGMQMVFANDAQQQQFITNVARQYHLPTKQLYFVLSHAKYLPSIIKKITSPYEKLPFDVYNKRLLTPVRIDQGSAFWKKHQDTLALAEKKYGVDPSVIIAILGVETLYGQREGNYSVLDSLYTLSFFYPPRHRFFSHELAEYLAMCAKQGISPFTVKGSYAGAFGMPQFMPSSYRAYGVDYSKDHHIDLMHNTDDAIMSVANFLAKAGWQRSQPIASQIESHSQIPAQYISARATPNTTISQLEKHGIYSKISTSKKQPASIIALNDQEQTEYWLAFPNLKSIMRYNPSLNYAMTVYQLSEAIREAHVKQDKHTA